MYSISICDDEQFMRDKMEKLILAYFTEKNMECTLRAFSSGEELSRYSGITDIAFLDVEMKNLSGIQTGYSLIKRNPDVVIFIITSHSEYLDEAMDLGAFRFLEKPVDKERLFSALDIITEQSSKITFVSEHLPVTLREREIACIYSFERKTYVLTDMGVRYPTIQSMKEWLRRTENIPCYSHPHYSYIVNMKYVIRVDGKDILIKLKNGTVVRIEASQRRINKFRNEFATVMRCKF